MFDFICLPPHRDSLPRWLPASTKPVHPEGSRCPGCSRPPSKFLLPGRGHAHRYSETSSTHLQGPAFPVVPTHERGALRQDNRAAYQSRTIDESPAPPDAAMLRAIADRSSRLKLAAEYPYVGGGCMRHRVRAHPAHPYRASLPCASKKYKGCAGTKPRRGLAYNFLCRCLDGFLLPKLQLADRVLRWGLRFFLPADRSSPTPCHEASHHPSDTGGRAPADGSLDRFQATARLPVRIADRPQTVP